MDLYIYNSWQKNGNDNSTSFSTKELKYHHPNKIMVIIW